MRKIICLALFLFSTVVLPAQTNVDSLVHVLNTKKLTDEEKIQLYRNIVLGYWGNDSDKTILYAHEALNVSGGISSDLWCARFSRILGYSYIHINADSSLHYLKNAKEFAIKAKDKQEEAITAVYTGSLYTSQGKYELALQHFMDALPSLEDLEHHEQQANALINIAKIYTKLLHIDLALKYCEQALDIAEKHNLIYAQMVALESLGDIYYEKKEYNKAVYYLLDAYNVSRRQNDIPRVITITQMLANAYCSLKEYDTAQRYAEECLDLADKVGSDFHKSLAWSVMWNVKFGQKHYKESEIYARKRWEADSTQLSSAVYAALNLCISNIYLGNHQEANYFLDKYVDMKNELTGQDLNSRLADMEVKYETEKKEMRIAALEEEQRLYIGLAVAIVSALLMGIGLLFYRHRAAVQKQKLAGQQIKQLQQEKELIATRSALDAEKTEREIIARDLHDGVGAMLSVVKNNMDIMKSYSIIKNAETEYFYSALDILDKSIVELRRVAHHIMPATLIDKGLAVALEDFCRSIPEAEFHSTDPSLRFDPEKELILYRCAYELVNNALRHAEASHIDIHLNMNEKTVYLSVVDNGCGFDPQAAPMGMGIGNMRARLSAFGGHIDIYSGPCKGTEANVELDL